MGRRRLRLLGVAGTVLLLVVGAYAVGGALGWEPVTRSVDWVTGATPPSEPDDRGGTGGSGDVSTGAARRVGPPPDMVITPQPIVVPLSLPLGFGDGPSGSLQSTGRVEVALTFDDGPDPRWTPQVLDLLWEHRVTATFCMVGELAEAYPDLVAAIAEAGHTLCNHSWRHGFDLGSRSREEIRRDLMRTNEAIAAAVPGAQVRYFRQPGGFWTPTVVDVAAELGMSSLHWTVDPRDWSEPGAAHIAAVVRNQTGPGAIVLLHDGGRDRSGTVEALRAILPDLTARFTVTALPIAETGQLCLPDCLHPAWPVPVG